MWATQNAINSPFCNTLPSLALLVMLFSVCEREHTAYGQKKPTSDMQAQVGDSIQLEHKSAISTSTHESQKDHAEKCFPAAVLVAFFSTFAHWERKVNSMLFLSLYNFTFWMRVRVCVCSCYVRMRVHVCMCVLVCTSNF